MSSYLKVLPAVIVSILIIFMYWKIKNIDETKELSSALIDKNFPTLNLEKLHGKAEFKDLVGEKFFIVNFFASWCAPCRTEHKVLTFIAKEQTLIGIGYKDTQFNLSNFIIELGNPYNAIFLDKDGRAGIELGLYGVPETYFIGKDGKIKYRHVGPITKEKFNDIILEIRDYI